MIFNLSTQHKKIFIFHSISNRIVAVDTLYAAVDLEPVDSSSIVVELFAAAVVAAAVSYAAFVENYSSADSVADWAAFELCYCYWARTIA